MRERVEQKKSYKETVTGRYGQIQRLRQTEKETEIWGGRGFCGVVSTNDIGTEGIKEITEIDASRLEGST